MRYIIKKHYEPTESNRTFKDSVFDYYTGKKNIYLTENKMPSAWLAEEYGYTTLAGAKKALKAAQELADKEMMNGHWNITVELIEF